MPTYDIEFNISKGRTTELARLPGANDGLVAIPLEASGIVSAATMKDYATVAALLAGATNEQTTMGRKALTGVTVTVDNANDWVDVDCDDVVWTAATGNAVAAVLIAYDPDTTGGSDSDLIPLVLLDWPVTPGGGNATMEIASGGFYRAV